MFNKNKRAEGIVSIKEILRQETNDIVDNDYLKDFTYNKDTDNDVKLDDNICLENESNKENSEKIKDIKAYLNDKGYITDYSVLSEEEKNNIMIELMKLKEKGMISLDDYYEESAELWKK